MLADPIIQEPTAIAFDGNGRMFVVEDRSYMLDLDMTGQLDPISRISLHVDTNNDGVYDKHTVFVDNLVFPRFVTPFGPNTILTKESNAQEVWKYTDTNGDGVADKKELFDTGYGRLANIEGQEAFLTWTLDNWMYSTYNAFRARWTPHGVIKEPTGSQRRRVGRHAGQRRQDLVRERRARRAGRAFSSRSSTATSTVPDQLEPDFRIPWGAPVRVADMQGGLNATRMPDGSLKSVTGSAGNDIYRGHRLPQDLVGEYLYGEPVGAHRPPDPPGEEGRPHDPPQRVSEQRVHQVARPALPSRRRDDRARRHRVHHGHVPRHHPGRELRADRARTCARASSSTTSTRSFTRAASGGWSTTASSRIDRTRCGATAIVPRMNNETPAQLVTHLSHPNGWWRDTAQQLLVLKQDKSVVPALQTIVRTSPNLLARFHAMWTLEGLGALDAGARRGS